MRSCERRLALSALALVLFGCGGGSRPVAMVAASMHEVVAAALADAGIAVQTVTAASSTLARQIEAGAPALLFVSAHPEWVDRLIELRLADPATRRELARNRLVFIAPVGSVLEIDVGDPATWPARIAFGDPAHVPAGRHAREALQARGQWQRVAPRVVAAADVRAALTLVARGEVDLGIVYATDASSSPVVRVLGAMPSAPIVYEVIAMHAEPELARAAIDALTGPAAAERMREAGFLPPGS